MTLDEKMGLPRGVTVPVTLPVRDSCYEHRVSGAKLHVVLADSPCAEGGPEKPNLTIPSLRWARRAQSEMGQRFAFHLPGWYEAVGQWWIPEFREGCGTETVTATGKETPLA